MPRRRRCQCHIARPTTWRISAKDSCLPRITRLLIPPLRKGPETPRTRNVAWKSHKQGECVLGLKFRRGPETPRTFKLCLGNHTQNLDICSELDLLAKNLKMLHLNTQYYVCVTVFGWSVVCMLCAGLSYLTPAVTAVITAWFNKIAHSLCYEIKNLKSEFSQVWVIWRLVERIFGILIDVGACRSRSHSSRVCSICSLWLDADGEERYDLLLGVVDCD